MTCGWAAEIRQRMGEAIHNGAWYWGACLLACIFCCLPGSSAVWHLGPDKFVPIAYTPDILVFALLLVCGANPCATVLGLMYSGPRRSWTHGVPLVAPKLGLEPWNLHHLLPSLLLFGILAIPGIIFHPVTYMVCTG